jgi:IclR family transcriptional regulator, pca regulon regulatory protein
VSPSATDAFPTLAEGRYSQSLERGLAILGCFDPDSPVLGIADIADRVGMSRSTTHRYAISLVALDFLERTAGRKYRLGTRVSDIGMLALNARPLRAAGRLPLEELRRKVSYTVSLAVLDEDQLLFMDRLRGYRGHARLGLNIGIGSRLALHCTSMGKILLAHLPDEQREETIDGLTLNRQGPNTITQKPILLRASNRMSFVVVGGR